MFLNLVMLAGLGGAAVPLALHMLNRSRYKSINWGAMMFLEGIDSRQRQSARIKQAVLLAIRTVLVAGLAMALARPITRGRWNVGGAQGPIAAVIVLDRSYSMTFEENGRSRFESARSAALQVLRGLREGDRAALVLMGDVQETPFNAPIADLQAVARFIQELKPPTGTANISKGLGKAADLLERTDVVDREIYVISDRQAIGWNSVDARFASGWNTRLQEKTNWPAPPRMVVIPVGGDEADNVCVESVQLLDPPAIRETGLNVEVKIRNYSASRRLAVPLTLRLQKHQEQSRQVSRTTVNLEPASTTTVRVPFVINDRGAYILSARVEAPGLAADNRFDYALDVLDRLRVLLISGDERGGAFRAESTYVQAALSPFQRGRGNPAEVTVSKELWPSSGLRGYSLVVLANVPQLTPSQARTLEQYVFEGGGLLVAPGDLSRVDNYNTVLYRNGAGLLPAQLMPATGNWSQPTVLGALDAKHPIFHFLSGSTGMPTSVIGRYFPTLVRSDSTDANDAGVHVLAWYGTTPALPYAIEGTLGNGRVMLLTTPLDADWNSLPLSNFYLPFVQSAARYSSGPALPSRNVVPGGALTVLVDDAVDERTAAIATPDDAPVDRSRLSVTPMGSRWQVQYNGTEVPGTYRLLSGGNEMTFVVQPSRNESDLTPLSAHRWQELESLLKFERFDSGPRAVASELAHARSGRELWLTFMIGVIVLAMFEIWVAGRWSRHS